MTPRSWLVGLAGALLSLAACSQAGAYQCATATDCARDGVAGSCVAAADGRSYCAYASGGCAGGGLRFGDAAGAYANQCVTASIDAPLPDYRPECVVGDALARAATSCPAVCDRLAACCTVSWSQMCVQLAETECQLACGARVAFLGLDGIDVYDFVKNGSELIGTALPRFGAAAESWRGGQWADFGRDGTAELVAGTAAKNGGPRHLVLRVAGGALTQAFDLADVGVTSYSTLVTAVGDYDDDGHVDIALTGIYPSLHLIRRTGVTFTAGPEISGPPQDIFASGGDFGDFDNDGDDDLVIGDYNNGNGTVLRWNRSTMTLEAVAPFGPFGRVSDLAFGDLDGDGDLDLAQAGNERARVLRNTGTGFDATPLWSFSAGVNAVYNDVTWIDVDGDHDLDLALGSGEFGGAPLLLFENTGGDLADQPVWSSPQREVISRMAATDVDGDGWLDLVLAADGNRDQPFFSRIYTNNRDRSFALAWTAPGDPRPVYGVATTRP